MIKLYQLTPILIHFMYGASFSLCTLLTMNDLFYRKIKRISCFPVISGALFGITAFVENRWFGGIWLAPLFILYTTAVFFLMTDKSKDHLLALAFSVPFSASLISSIQTAVFSVSNVKESSFLPVTLLYLTAYIISVGFVILLKRLVRSEDREPLGLLQMILLTCVSYAATAIVIRSFTMSDYVPDVAPEAAIPSVLMLMSVTVLLLLSIKQQQAKRFHEMNELNEKYMTVQAKHFEQSKAADTEMRMLRHDMKNHITVMKGLFDSGKTDELGKYLRELGDAFSDSQAVNITGNEIADAIINEKTNYAEMNGVSLVSEGSLKGLEISAVVLCTVLSNLLDNAIEAAAQTATGCVITLSAKKSGSYFYLCICNPTTGSVDVSADIPTSKPESDGHGLGLKSARKAIEKCGGTLELSCKESATGYIFTSEVILPAKQT